MQRNLLVVSVLVSATALGSSVARQNLAQQMRSADRVVFAEVVSSEVRVPNGDVRHMTTETTLAVLEDYKGHGPATLRLEQLGGTHGLWESHIPGDAHFTPGETAVLFLRCPDRAHLDRCFLLGLSAGKVPVVHGAGGEDALLSAGASRVRKPLESFEDALRSAAKEGAR